jgi:hypothetical protein
VYGCLGGLCLCLCVLSGEDWQLNFQIMCLSQESKSICKAVITVCPELKVIPHLSGDKLRKNSCLVFS